MATLNLVAIFLCVFQVIALVSGLKFVLDKESEKDLMWKIKGDTVYLESGQQLRRPPVNQYLPSDFKFRSFDLSDGIWAVVPSKNRDCVAFEEPDSFEKWSSEETDDLNGTLSTIKKPPCNVTASGSFQCSLKAQMVDSVSVRYNFGGNATIRITGGRKYPFETSANNVASYNWDHFKVDNIDGRTVTVEAIVHDEHDYILIDSITIETPEVPTTPRPVPTTRRHPTTTSEMPETTPSAHPTHGPSPASGQSGMITLISQNIILVGILLTAVKSLLF